MKLINKTSILVLCISFLAAFGLISCGESGNNPPSELEEDNSNNNQDLDESEDEVSMIIMYYILWLKQLEFLQEKQL